MDKDHTLIRRIAPLQRLDYISATHDNADKNRKLYTIDLGFSFQHYTSNYIEKQIQQPHPSNNNTLPWCSYFSILNSLNYY